MLVAKQAVELYFIRNDTPISFRMFFLFMAVYSSFYIIFLS